jgi:hypothetical protein
VLRAFGLVEQRDGEVGGRDVGRARLVGDEIVGAEPVAAPAAWRIPSSATWRAWRVGVDEVAGAGSAAAGAQV